ncbi:MAG: thioredoxin [Nitrososphaerales archaeon]
MSDPELEEIMKKKIQQMNNPTERLVELGEKNFDDIVAGGKPVLVDFWASWCGPCQFMLPIFDKLAKKYGDKVVFARLNVDTNQSVAARYDVYAIPTFIVFQDGKAIDRAIGAVGEPGLENLIKKHS